MIDEAIAYALAHRNDMRIESKERERANKRVDEARGAFQPTLDVTADAKQTRLYDTFSGITIETSIGGQPVTATVEREEPRYQSNLSLETVLNLYAGGADTARLDQAFAESRAAKGREEARRHTAILQVAAAYVQLRKAERQVARLEQALALANEEAAVAAHQFEQGQIARIEKEARQLQAEETRVHFSTARGEHVRSWDTYLQSLGMDPAAHPVPANGLLSRAADVSLTGLIAPTGSMPPMLARAEAERDAALAVARQERAAFRPLIDLFARYTYGDRDDETWRRATGADRQERAVGLRMRWNWYNGGRSSVRHERALLEAEIKDIQQQEYRQQWFMTMRRNEQRVSDLRNDYELTKKRLAIAQAQATIARQRLALNQITDTQLRAVLLSLAEVEDRLDAARMDLELANLELHLGMPQHQMNSP